MPRHALLLHAATSARPPKEKKAAALQAEAAQAPAPLPPPAAPEPKALRGLTGTLGGEAEAAMFEPRFIFMMKTMNDKLEEQKRKFLGILHGKKMWHAPCHPHETQEHACAKATEALILALERNFGVVGMSKFGHF